MRKIIIAFSIAFITTLCTYASDWQFTIGTGLTLPYSRLHAKNGKMGSLMTRNAETHYTDSKACQQSLTGLFII